MPRGCFIVPSQRKCNPRILVRGKVISNIQEIWLKVGSMSL